jgi:hypothetical protein
MSLNLFMAKNASKHNLLNLVQGDLIAVAAGENVEQIQSYLNSARRENGYNVNA